jgi:hypothetical protein
MAYLRSENKTAFGHPSRADREARSMSGLPASGKVENETDRYESENIEFFRIFAHFIDHQHEVWKGVADSGSRRRAREQGASCKKRHVVAKPDEFLGHATKSSACGGVKFPSEECAAVLIIELMKETSDRQQASAIYGQPSGRVFGCLS